MIARAARGIVTALTCLVPLGIALTATPASGVAPGTPSGTIFVTNLTANTVSAINATTHQVTVIRGSTYRLQGPLGIAITPDGTHAYVTNSLSDTVSPLSLMTSPPSVGPPIRVGGSPAAIAITPNGNVAYVTNFDSNTVTPINLRTTPPTAEPAIAVGAGPWSIAASPDDRFVCVSNSEANTVSVIATATRTVTTVTVGGRPQAIAISPDSYTAYVANGSQITPISLRSQPVRVESPIAVGAAPVGIAVTPNGTTTYSANADNTITPIHLNTQPPTVGATVPIGSLSQPDGIAISTDGSTAYTADAGTTVTPIDLATSPVRVESPIAVGTASFGIAIEADQAPTARLQVIPGAAGRATTFNASLSTSPDGKIIRYRWNFGDGTKAVTRTPVIRHVYRRAGSYQATVTVTSAGGTSLATTYTGQTVSNNGSRRARAELSFQVAALLQVNPPTGSPGTAIALRDATFTGTCRPVYVRFDRNLIAQISPSGQVLDDPHLVIPGNASVGRHRISVGCSANGATLLSVDLRVVSVKNHLSEFSVAMPTLGQFGRNLPDAGAIGILMLLLGRLFSAGFPSEWIDRTYEENRERFSAPLRRRFPRLFVERAGPSSLARRLVMGTGLFLAFAAFGGLVNSFLDPSFGLNRTTLWLFLGQFVGIGLISLTGQVPSVVSALRAHRQIHLQVLAGGLVIAVVCVAASRAIGLSPGYCYGLIAGFLIVPEYDDKDRGRLHALGSLCVLIVSSAAFLLSIPVFHAATSPSPSPALLILDPALNVVFLAGFASLAFGMFPLPFLPGRHVAKWNETIWLALSGAGLIGFVGVLLSPGSGSSGEVHHVGLVPMLIAFGVFGSLSLTALVYFHYHPLEKGKDDEDDVIETVASVELPGADA
ncbi:MAG: FGLLP motif-containing membrane protein [Acidimicrobiales bacterium]